MATRRRRVAASGPDQAEAQVLVLAPESALRRACLVALAHGLRRSRALARSQQGLGELDLLQHAGVQWLGPPPANGRRLECLHKVQAAVASGARGLGETCPDVHRAASSSSTHCPRATIDAGGRGSPAYLEVYFQFPKELEYRALTFGRKKKIIFLSVSQDCNPAFCS